MKSHIKGYIAGFMSALVLLSSINVYADGLNKTLDVLVNKINIAINGAVVGKAGADYTLDNGDKVPFSILYKGTTYLPIRKITELIGKSVQWDGNSNTASINDNNINHNVSATVSNEFQYFFKEYEEIYVKPNEDGLYSVVGLAVADIAKVQDKYYLHNGIVTSLLNIIEGKYIIENLDNPFLLGRLVIKDPLYTSKIEQKYTSINTYYYDFNLYRISDISKSLYFTPNEEPTKGLFLLTKTNDLLLSLDGLLAFFEYDNKIKIEFDEVNKIMIINLTDYNL